MVLLMVIMVIAALFLCQLLNEYIEDEVNPVEMRNWIYERYGSGSRATWTMLEVTLSGGWPNYARPLVEIYPHFSLFWGLYVSSVTFAVIRIITAIFLRETSLVVFEMPFTRCLSVCKESFITTKWIKP